jgi:hypothetical protein
VAVFPLRDHDTFTTHWRERILADEANYAWTIAADGEVAGHMLCFERDGKREVGYWLGRAYWGRGIATHGTPHDYDAHVPVIFYGPPFKPGKYDEFARVVDMAPTLAEVTGTRPLERLDGHPLRAALR